MKTLSDIDVSGKRVFLRADLDVILGEAQVTNGERLMTKAEVEQSTRLVNLKPTVDWLIEHGAKQIFIAGHIDRPVNFDPQLSTRHLEAPLEAVLRRSVTYKKDLNLGDGTLASMAQIILLENLRFWPGEEKNDQDFARQLAGIADVYVNDAFATCHREHASMVGVPALLPHAAGLHLEEEIKVLGDIVQNPVHPFVVIIGGIKVETKIPLFEKLSRIADHVLIGGYLPIEIGERGDKFASNVLVATNTSDKKDISSESTGEFAGLIKGAKTIFWNGNMGLTEEGYDKATMAIAKAIAESGANSVVGGGNTVDFLSKHAMFLRFTHVSTGGGAMLEFLAGRQLPALAALD